MKTRTVLSPELLRLVALQAGAITTEQARGLGVGRHALDRLVRAGDWQRVESGLVIVGPGEPSWLALAWGGVLLAGDESRLGLTAAAHLYGLVEDPPRPITVLVPHGRPPAPRFGWEFRQERRGVRLASTGRPPPRTSVEDTVLDLCDELDSERMVGLVTEAVQSRTTARRLRRRLAERPRARHRRLLQELLGDVEVGTESPLEVRYLRDVERAHGLPAGEWQRVNAATDRNDVRYDQFGTVVELDGRIGHEGTGRFRDMRRDNRSVVSGRVTLRYGHVDVLIRACIVAWQVGAVLIDRGWAGLPGRCDQCRHVPANGWDLAG